MSHRTGRMDYKFIQMLNANGSIRRVIFMFSLQMEILRSFRFTLGGLLNSYSISLEPRRICSGLLKTHAVGQ